MHDMATYQIFFLLLTHQYVISATCLSMCTGWFLHLLRSSRVAIQNVPIHDLTHPHTSIHKHTHKHYTQPIYSPVDVQIVFAAKSGWHLSKALLNIFPVSVFFMVLSRNFPWWPTCCRWEKEKLYVWIMNSHLFSSFSAKHPISSISLYLFSFSNVCVHFQT